MRRPRAPLNERAVKPTMNMLAIGTKARVRSHPVDGAMLMGGFGKTTPVDINRPIGCGDAPVFPGDVIVGDGDGVIRARKRPGRPSIVGLYRPTSEETQRRHEAWLKARSE